MKNSSKNSTYLKWTVWICAVVLALAVGLLVFLEVDAAQKRQSIQAPPPVEPQPSETQTMLPESTENSQETLPVWDMPENPYGPEDFVRTDGYLTCTAGQSVLGIDVSAWQEKIDWAQVKAAGVEFAMIRLAWRGSSEGGLFADQWAVRNYEGAKSAGLQVGGYIFSQAITPEEAVEEAEFLLAMIEDWELDMPIVYDWEFAGGPRTDGMETPDIIACAKAFCETIEEAGYRVMIYFNPNMTDYEHYLKELEEYGYWLAMWKEEMDFPYRVDMWQYTDQGAVPGIDGNVDMNVYFVYADE